MALIEIYHIVASSQPVDPASLEIKEGMLVALTGDGARRVTTGDAGKVFGIAGDTKSTSASAMPGIYSGWQNRVSDYFDESKASAKLTVYHSGGEFATDQYVASGSLNASGIGGYLEADETTGKMKWQATTRTVASVAQLTGAAGVYPSGVPGVDINGDMALKGENDNEYITIKLLV
jgi:hypothetical protein